MKLTQRQLAAAVQAGIISERQQQQLLVFLQHSSADVPAINFTHFLYYLGGFLAIGAMTLFMNLGWESFGGTGIVGLSLLYALGGLLLANRFQRHGYAIPAGICTTFVVGLTPLAIYGLQQAFGLWPDVATFAEHSGNPPWNWLQMILSTLGVGIIMARIYRYPFLMLPIAVALWCLSLELARLWWGGNYELQTKVSMYFGLGIIVVALWVDLKSINKADYPFWLYISGVLAFWGGLSLQYSDSELAKLIYFGINLILMLVGVLLVRRVFVVCAALGASFYLGHLAAHVFQDSWLFPVALTGIGLLVIVLGVLWQKNEPRLTKQLRSQLPLALQALLEAKY